MGMCFCVAGDIEPDCLMHTGSAASVQCIQRLQVHTADGMAVRNV